MTFEIRVWLLNCGWADIRFGSKADIGQRCLILSSGALDLVAFDEGKRRLTKVNDSTSKKDQLLFFDEDCDLLTERGIYEAAIRYCLLPKSADHGANDDGKSGLSSNEGTESRVRLGYRCEGQPGWNIYGS